MLDVTHTSLLLPLPLPLEDPYRQFIISNIPSAGTNDKGSQTPEFEGSQLNPRLVALETHFIPMPQHVLLGQQAPPDMQ